MLLLWCYSDLSFKSHSRNVCVCYFPLCFHYKSILTRLSVSVMLPWHRGENMLIWLSNREYSITFSWLLINVGGSRSLRMRPLFGIGPGYKISRWRRYGEYASNWCSSRTSTSVPGLKPLIWGPALISFSNELQSEIENRSKHIHKLLLVMLFNHSNRILKTASTCHHPLC